MLRQTLLTLLIFMLSIHGLLAQPNGGGAWQSVVIDGVMWDYEVLAGTETCRIKPNEYAQLREPVAIPVTILTADKITLRVVEIASQAFTEIKGVKNLAIPEGIVTLAIGAFLGCDDLETLSIPASVARIELPNFTQSFKLKEIKVADGNTNYCSEDGVLFTKDKSRLLCYPSAKKGHFEIPSGVRAIDTAAFAFCAALEAIVVPKGVERIRPMAFVGCTNLTSIGLAAGNENFYAQDGVIFTKAKDSLLAFPAGREGIYDIPSFVTTIATGAFGFCEKLTGLTVPAGVNRIEDAAIDNCQNLASVFWLAPADCVVEKMAFAFQKPYTTLYVRLGELGVIQRKDWTRGFKNRKEGYVLTFSSPDGEQLGELMVEPDSPARKPTGIAREGYTISGWKLDGREYTFTEPVSGNLHIQVEWKRNEYTVVFDAKGGLPVPPKQKIFHGDAAKEPSEKPMKEGYTFEGWFKDEKDKQPYDFNAKVTGPLTLVARWKAVTIAPPAPSTPSTAVESALLSAARVVQSPIVGTLALDGLEEAQRVEVYSLAGVLVYTQELQGEGRIEIASSGWASGVYMARIVARDGERTLRVVKR